MKHGWHWVSFGAPVAGLGSLAMLVWAVNNRLDDWEVPGFVLLIYAAMGCALLGSMADWLAYRRSAGAENGAGLPTGEGASGPGVGDSGSMPPVLRESLAGGTRAEASTDGFAPTSGGSLTGSRTLDDTRPAGSGWDLDTEMEPVWEIARVLRWTLWILVLLLAAWLWLPQAQAVVGWWQRQVTLFRFR